jgi:hypothetical protein
LLVTLPSVESDDNYKSSSPSTCPTSSSTSETEEENEDELELEENEEPEEEEVHSEYQKSDIGKSGKYVTTSYVQTCTRPEVYVISYLLCILTCFHFTNFFGKKNSARCLLKTKWLMKICHFEPSSFHQPLCF